jgi:hypothetical protein
VHLFKPKTKTGMTGFQSWLQRRQAEFKQPDFACQSEGREGAAYLHLATTAVPLHDVSNSVYLLQIV